MPRSSVACRGLRLLGGAPLSLVVAVAACASGRQARLDAHGVAMGAAVPAAALGPSKARAVEASGPGVVADHVLEARLRRELQDKWVAGGASALEVIEPGATVESRLRFVLSRVVLDRTPEARAALEGLTADVPDCALAWFLLGHLREQEGDAEAAAALLRRARSAERAQGISPHPSLDYLLGRALLRTDEADEGLRLLREQLVSSPHRVAAAELLAQVAAEDGDFEAALAAVDAVLDDVPDEPSLVAVKAELLADQLRFEEASTLLERRGNRVPAPALLHRRALLQRQQGNAAAASVLLADLLDKHGDDASVKASLAGLQTLRAELETERATQRRTGWRVRELLGILRYGRQPVERLDAMRRLCRGNAPQAAIDAAVRWALLDPHAAMRIAAVQTGLTREGDPTELLLAGLQDPAAEVRSATAAAAARRELRGALGHLVDAIERETDPDAFRTIHRALATVSGRELPLPFDGERVQAIRERVAKDWRSEYERAGKGTSGT